MMIAKTLDAKTIRNAVVCVMDTVRGHDDQTF